MNPMINLHMDDMNMERCMVDGKTRTGQPDYPVETVLGNPVYRIIRYVLDSDNPIPRTRKTTKEKKLQNCLTY